MHANARTSAPAAQPQQSTVRNARSPLSETAYRITPVEVYDEMMLTEYPKHFCSEHATAQCRAQSTVRDCLPNYCSRCRNPHAQDQTQDN